MNLTQELDTQIKILENTKELKSENILASWKMKDDKSAEQNLVSPNINVKFIKNNVFVG